MLTQNFTMNIIGLLAVIAASALAGFILTRRQIGKYRLSVSQLEREMVNNHTEILELQKEYVNMEVKLTSEKDPPPGESDGR
jgi:hypothetical protein